MFLFPCLNNIIESLITCPCNHPVIWSRTSRLKLWFCHVRLHLRRADRDVLPDTFRGRSDPRFFFVALAGILAVINVVGFLMIWRSSPTIIDEIFLMTPDGLLLKHYTRRLRPDQDEDILAGMLTAVQTFIKESFDESGGPAEGDQVRELRHRDLALEARRHRRDHIHQEAGEAQEPAQARDGGHRAAGTVRS